MKFINYLMLAVFILFSFTAIAADQVESTDYIADIATLATDTLSITTQNVVTGVILCASDASAVLELYDTDVTSTRAAALADAGAPKIKLKVATDEDSKVWTGNVIFTTGIFVYLEDGEALIIRPTGNY